MQKIFARLRDGWHSLRLRDRSVPFNLPCSCGQLVQGQRSCRALLVQCPVCGQSYFIFPASPWPHSVDERLTPPAIQSLRFWLKPLAAGLVTLIVVALGLSWFISVLLHSPDRDIPPSASPTAETPTASQFLSQARQSLQRGHLDQAHKLLSQALQAHPGDLAVRHLHRQAALLADLLDRPLQEIVEQAQLLQMRGQWAEWDRQFARYRNRAVLLDDVVRRDAQGRHSLATLELLAGNQLIHLDLNLKVLEWLNLDEPRRLLLGARLRAVRPGGAGGWIVEFEADSGVLFTDEAAVAACELPLEDLKPVLHWQREELLRLGQLR